MLMLIAPLGEFAVSYLPKDTTPEPQLKGRHFDTILKIQSESQKVIDRLRTEYIRGTFQKWQELEEQCIAVHGDYFEGGKHLKFGTERSDESAIRFLVKVLSLFTLDVLPFPRRCSDKTLALHFQRVLTFGLVFEFSVTDGSLGFQTPAWKRSGHRVCLCIAKVLTVQVVLRNIYCSEGTSSNAQAMATPRPPQASERPRSPHGFVLSIWRIEWIKVLYTPGVSPNIAAEVVVAEMESRWWLVCLCLAAVADETRQNSMSCDRVHKLLQLQQIDTTGLLNTPGTESDLQVCLSRGATCCTRKVEEEYQTAVHQDFQNLLQTFSSNLKFLITQSIAALQETLDSVAREVQSHTSALLRVLYGDLGSHASSPLAELFTDVGLFLLGAELNLEEATQRFFQALFPLVYDQLEKQNMAPLDPVYQECVRSVGRRAAAYGNAPIRLAALVSRASEMERTFLQSMHLAAEVINTTDHAQPSRECRRALMRMRYCPLCQALADSKPCMGYCLNVLRGCLASLAELDAHWQEFVRSLEALSARMQDGDELEHVIASIPPLIADAVAHMSKNAAKIKSQVRSLCGEPVHFGHIQQRPVSDTLHLETPEKTPEDTLSHKRREFLTSLRHYRAFYGGLADQMCVRELASTDGLACWNGNDVVKSYTKRVVGSGIRAQAQNPEVRVKEADPVIHQVIDKLKHINQLLQGHSIPKLGTLDQIEMGSGDVDVMFSGQCDDEDGCWGSGDGAGETWVANPPEFFVEKEKRERGENSNEFAENKEGGRKGLQMKGKKEEWKRGSYERPEICLRRSFF
ncbi:glypican-5 precursor [Silurus asotus]|uniref:Glypican-5 n=1 Tax=Silurus asotus TaxID=30991 RepID=A0AAD5FKV1_SILAS|nr:glypican-5 precursor [Silurus asotus]